MAKEFRRGNRISFDHCVIAMGSGHIARQVWEVSYRTFGFGAIIRRDLRTLSLPRDSPRDNQYAFTI